jgi:hypothetical protein
MTTNEFIPELIPRGVYHVGDQVYYNKVKALEAADNTGQHPRWDFHDDWFGRFDWTQEPEQSLDFWYSMRCQQIRDKYDYLVLHYSGGSDSHNMLNYFYRNKIHIDEVLTALPISYFEKCKSPDTSTLAKDSHNEWFHVVKPDLAWIAKHMPKTKITTYDYTDDMINFNVDQDWIYHAGEHINPNIANRIQRYYKIDTSNVYDKYRVGHVYGIDKPLVFRRDDGWYTAFLDSVISVQSSVKPVVDNHTHISVEYFYWSPDLPQMLIKQAHMVKKLYDLKPHLAHLATFKKKNPDERELERDLSREAVYPYWRREIFQNRKPSGSFFKEFDQWFFEQATESAKACWWEGFNFLISSIDKKWINYDANGNINSLTGFYSKMHRIA